MQSHDLGHAAEAVAEHHLRAEGYEIVAKNFRTKRAEIDLICRRGNHLLFVEVKGRTRFRPEETWLPFWRRKKWRIYSAARVFLRQHPHLSREAEEFGLEVLFVTQGRVTERFSEGNFF
jgi:putative endonuclease